MSSSFYDMPSFVDSQSLPFILKRLNEENFDLVTALTKHTRDAFRKILNAFFTKKISFEEACNRTEQEIVPPPTYKKISRWAERLVRTEASKIFTLGYGDYLISIGEKECFIPHTKFDESEECRSLIAGKKFPIELIQKNIYANYGMKKPMHPTVPLHANCRHVITKI